MQPQLSICITTYNLEKYIKDAIESVLVKNVSFEIEILINDNFYKQKPSILTSSIIFRKDLIIDLKPLDEKEYFNGDVLLFSHLILQSKFKIIDDYTTVYRILASSASHIINQTKKMNFI